MAFAVHSERADGDGEVEAAGAAGAGVEVEDTAFVGDAGDVGVAVENGCESPGHGIKMEGVQVVEHVDVAGFLLQIFDEDDFGFGEFATGAFTVDVAADGGYWGDFAEVVEDGDFAYVAQVKNARDTGEGGEDFGAEEAVGVADYCDFHGDSVGCELGSWLRFVSCAGNHQ